MYSNTGLNKMSTEDIKFGRTEIYDRRDDDYPAGTFLAALPNLQLSSRYWYCNGWTGDQGSSNHCTAYSWLAYLHDGPIVQESFAQKPMYNPKALYDKFQENDGIIKRSYEGSTVRAGAKVLKKLGFIKEYRWTRNIDEITKALLVFGPVIVGSHWYSDMLKTDSNGKVEFSGRNIGGHAYILNGVDVNKNLYRIKNSWGRRWGIQSHGFIDINDFERLIAPGGEICIPLESQMNYIPDLNSVISEDVP